MQKPRIVLKVALCCMLSVVLSACGGGGDDSSTTTENTIREIKLSPSVSQVPLYTDLTIRAQAVYSDGSSEDVSQSVTWTSSDTSKAVFSSSTANLLQSKAQGTVTISASIRDVSSATTVTISSPELLSLQLSKQTLELALGETDSIQVQGTYKGDVVVDVTDDVQWTSANDAIATVSSSGSVKGIATDSTEVTAELDGITSTATISVGEASLRSIAISASSNDIFEGSTSQLTASATYSDSDGSPKDVTEQVTWQSGTPEVASVSDAAPANGLVSALSQGSSIITAQLGEFTVETSLNIVAAPNKPGALTLQATPNVILNNASDRAVITATVMPNDEANGVIADGTMVELTPSNADLALSSAQGGTVSGKFTTDVTSAAAGQFVIIGEVPNTIAIDEAALRVVSSFSDVIDVSGFALRVVDDETGEVKAGSTFSATIINTSNRTFEINEVEFFNGSTLVASFSPGEDALEAGESVDVSISLNQDRSDNGFSIVFGLSDAPTSTQFSVEQVF